MVNDRNILNRIELEKKVKSMADRDLLEFTFWEVHGMGRRVTVLEKRDRKFFGTVGGISGIIGAGVMAAMDFLLRRGNG